MTTKTMSCRCGSGLTRRPLTDAAGIFCCYVCDECEEQSKEKYRPEIFDSLHPYAASGHESDLAMDYYGDDDD